MLAHVYEPHRVTFPVYVQPKFNGIRALYQGGRFQSRDELPWHPAVLKHISDQLEQHFQPDVILDGELYVHGWPLQRINGAVQIARTAPREDTHEVRYMIFDRVDFTESFDFRFMQWKKELPPDLPCAFAATERAANENEVNALYTSYVAEGFEGIMYRVGACPYTRPKQHRATPGPLGGLQKPRTAFISDKNNRVWHLLKRKAWQDGEFPCIDIEEGVGKRAGGVGAFILRTQNGERFRVGSGLTDHEARLYFQDPNQVIGHQIKVKFLTLTERGVPFNPTFEAIL